MSEVTRFRSLDRCCWQEFKETAAKVLQLKHSSTLPAGSYLPPLRYFDRIRPCEPSQTSDVIGKLQRRRERSCGVAAF